MRVRVLAFARLRELVGASEFECDVPEGATAGAFWNALERERPALRGFAASTKLARAGRVLGPNDALAAGDEIALLPPFGGG